MLLLHFDCSLDAPFWILPIVRLVGSVPVCHNGSFTDVVKKKNDVTSKKTEVCFH